MKKVDTDKVLKWVQSNLDRKKIYKIINQGISDRESDALMKRVNKDLKLNIDTDDYKTQDWKDLDSAITSSIDKVFAKMDESVILIESYEDFLNEAGKGSKKDVQWTKDDIEKLLKQYKSGKLNQGEFHKKVLFFIGAPDKPDVNKKLEKILATGDVDKITKDLMTTFENHISEIYVNGTGMDDAVNRLNKRLSEHEVLDILIKVWSKVPLGARMNQGGMPREIPKHIQEGLEKLGYTITRIDRG